MQRWCPNCGKLNSRWPQILIGVAFFALLIVSGFESFRSHWVVFNLVSGLAFLVFVVGNIGLGMRNNSQRGDEVVLRRE
jgi:hypothetical protein